MGEGHWARHAVPLLRLSTHDSRLTTDDFMAIIDVIQHPNERSDEIVYRVPQQGAGEFAFGSQLIVREGQTAVFYRDGKALDVFGPGRYTLTTNNLPLLTGLMGIPFGG